jgi:hypothetical protein
VATGLGAAAFAVRRYRSMPTAIAAVPAELRSPLMVLSFPVHRSRAAVRSPTIPVDHAVESRRHGHNPPGRRCAECAGTCHDARSQRLPSARGVVGSMAVGRS